MHCFTLTPLIGLQRRLLKKTADPNERRKLLADRCLDTIIAYVGHGPGGEGARRSLCLGLGVPDHLGLDVAAAVLSGRLLAEVHRGLEKPAGGGMQGQPGIRRGAGTSRNDAHRSTAGCEGRMEGIKDKG